MNQYDRARQQEDAVKLKKKNASKKYRENNKEKIKEAQKAYAVKNKQKIREYHRWWEKLHQNDPKRKYRSYKATAKLDKRTFKISFEFASLLFNSNCYYCGSPPDPVNGIDRIKSDIGYVEDNCVSCCSLCNYMKMDTPKEEWLYQVNKIYNYQNKIKK